MSEIKIIKCENCNQIKHHNIETSYDGIYLTAYYCGKIDTIVDSKATKICLDFEEKEELGQNKMANSEKVFSSGKSYLWKSNY